MTEISQSKYDSIFKEQQFKKDKLASELQQKENKKEKKSNVSFNDMGYNDQNLEQPDFDPDKPDVIPSQSKGIK
jgi:hypothetical protein